MLSNYDKKTNPFKVPENYFQNLTGEIMGQISEEKIKSEFKVSFWKNVFVPTVIAASVCGLLFYIGFNFDQSSTDLVQINASPTYVANTIYEEEDYYQFLEDEYTEDSFKNMFYESVYN